MQITRQKLNTIDQRVEFCLDRYAETRNSDIDLFARLCENFYPPFEKALYSWRDLAGAMHSVPSMDHIARCRRKIIQRNNYKKYLPTDINIAIFRGLSEEIWRAYAKDNGIREPLNHESNIPKGYDDEGNNVSHG